MDLIKPASTQPVLHYNRDLSVSVKIALTLIRIRYYSYKDEYYGLVNLAHVPEVELSLKDLPESLTKKYGLDAGQHNKTVFDPLLQDLFVYANLAQDQLEILFEAVWAENHPKLDMEYIVIKIGTAIEQLREFFDNLEEIWEHGKLMEYIKRQEIESNE
jgi:hypothetical protein